MNPTMWAIISFGVLQFLGLVRAYYGLKQDNATQVAALTLAMLTEKSERHSEQGRFKSDLDAIIFRIDTSIGDLSHRVVALEAGTDEWSKSLRQRTHDLADKMQGLAMKVDRLERPTQKEPTV